MTASLGTLPTDDDGWAYEIKYDGYRTLAFIDDGAVRLQSRREHDVTATYPELGELAGSVHATTAILDGELCVLDDDGRPRFELIQRHEREAALFVFDVLRVDDHDTLGCDDEAAVAAQGLVLIGCGDEGIAPGPDLSQLIEGRFRHERGLLRARHEKKRQS